ncbi:MAG: hypothetical protein IPJ76_07240 [Flavobacteriales bacterium]|nr:MAG: hypothetical protein IPJ76_07240 [Flavobacteriales bacterium]
MERSTRTSKLLPGIALALSAAVIGLIAGAVLGRFVVPKSDGLAGAATVLAYGLGGGVLVVVLSIVFVRKMPRAVVVRGLWIAGPVALVLLGWSTKRFMDQKAVQDEQWQEEQERMRHMQPTATPTLFQYASLKDTRMEPRTSTASGAMGIGMFSPSMAAGTWPMYTAPDLFNALHRPAIVDSLVFAQGPHHMDIAYAPPWFVPAHMKLDYDLLVLRVITLSPNWVEVEVHAAEGRTVWVERTQGEVQLWPEFMLRVAAVETLGPAANPIRVKPLDHAGVLADGANTLLAPLAVQGDWLLVRTHALADRIQPTGWIRWRKDGVLLVEYSLLC